MSQNINAVNLVNEKLEGAKTLLQEFVHANIDQAANIIFLNKLLHNMQEANKQLSAKLDEKMRIIASYEQPKSIINPDKSPSNQGESDVTSSANAS